MEADLTAFTPDSLIQYSCSFPQAVTECRGEFFFSKPQKHHQVFPLLQGEGLCDSCGQGSIHPSGPCSGAPRVFILPWPLPTAQAPEMGFGTSWRQTSSTQKGVQSWALQQPCCPPGFYQCQGKRTDQTRTDRGPCSFSRQSQDGQCWQPAHRALQQGCHLLLVRNSRVYTHV